MVRGLHLAVMSRPDIHCIRVLFSCHGHLSIVPDWWMEHAELMSPRKKSSTMYFSSSKCGSNLGPATDSMNSSTWNPRTERNIISNKNEHDATESCPLFVAVHVRGSIAKYLSSLIPCLGKMSSRRLRSNDSKRPRLLTRSSARLESERITVSSSAKQHVSSMPDG